MSSVSDRDKHVFVLGSGTSGTFLAYRLLMTGFSVTLIDEEVDVKKSSDELWWETFFGLTPLVDLWTFEACESSSVSILRTMPQKALKDRSIGYPCKTGIGGNSGINAMMHDVGHDFVYNQYWPTAWNASVIRKYSSMVDEIIPPFRQTSSGNIGRILHGLEQSANSQSATKAVATSYPCCMTPTGRKRQRLIKVLEKLPSKAYERLTLIKGAVNRIAFNDSSAVSILMENGDNVAVDRRSRVFLCCGAVKSPTILYNSLSSGEGINSTASSLRNVIGERALDHFILPFVCFGNWRSQWKDTVTKPINGVHGWVFLDENGQFHKDDSPLPPRTQLILIDGSIMGGLVDVVVPRWHEQSWWWTSFRAVVVAVVKFILTLSFVRWLTGGVFGVLVCLVQPETRGSCSFSASKRTKDSYDINIDPQFFSSENDQKALHEAYLFARNSLQSSSQCGSLRYLECLPNFLLNYAKSRSVFVDFAAWFGTTYFHISGTCPMDRYEKGKVISKGVLGDDLKVRGLHNLYVADASVFPAIPSFPTAKLSMIVGLRAGDLMAETPRVKGKMQL